MHQNRCQEDKAIATQYTQQAEQQLAPVFQQQQSAIQSQVPAIQKLYETLTQGLQGNYQSQLTSGVKGIVEDASARGVLRSTLPVDARQALTGQLGAALQQSLGELGAKQAGDVAGVRTQLGELGIKRATSISDLSKTLEAQDLERQRLELERLTAERNYQLEQEKNAISRQSAASSAAAAAAPSIGVGLAQLFSGYKPAHQGGQAYYTEDVIIPQIMEAYGLSEAAAKQQVYAYRKRAFGEGFGS